MRRATDVIRVVLLSGMAVATLVGQAQVPLIVAYMRSDGQLVPIARYDGTVWRNTWPEPIEYGAPIPVRTIGEIPKIWLGGRVPLTWTTWSESKSSRTQQRARVTGLGWDGSCVGSITLTTSYKPHPPSDGLAFSRPTRVDSIDRMEKTSREWDPLRRELSPHFTVAISKSPLPRPGTDQGELDGKAIARARANPPDDDIVLDTVFQQARFPVFFIEAHREFVDIPADTGYDAVSYRGWFRRDPAGALIPITASLGAFSTAGDNVPRYTPIGVVRIDGASIWAMSEWGKESQTIVLFEIAATRVRKLTSAGISGC